MIEDVGPVEQNKRLKHEVQVLQEECEYMRHNRRGLLLMCHLLHGTLVRYKNTVVQQNATISRLQELAALPSSSEESE